MIVITRIINNTNSSFLQRQFSEGLMNWRSPKLVYHMRYTVVWEPGIKCSAYFLVGITLLVLCHIRTEKSYFSRKSNDISMKESHPERHQEIWWFSLGIENQFALNDYHSPEMSKMLKSTLLVPPLKTIYFVLFLFSERPFAQNHSNKLFISTFALWYKMEISVSLMTKEVSSAKDNICAFVDFDISLTHIRHSKGPRIDPCGTPQFMNSISDFVLPIWTYCFLFTR